MTLYRVEFSNDWIRGRWGFTDRVFNALKGRVTEPSRLENAWLVEYRGQPRALGTMLSEMLNIQQQDFRRFGTIFEIVQISEGEPDPGPRRPSRSAPAPWDVPPEKRRPKAT